MSIIGRLLGRRRRITHREPEPPRPRLGSPAETWLRRAEKSARALHELRDARKSDGPIVDVYTDVASGADALVVDLRRVAGEVRTVEQAIARIPSPQLQQRRHSLAATDAGAPELAELDAQLATDSRLRASRDELLSRMQAGAVALDGLLARAAELDVTGGSATLPGKAELTTTAAELRDRLDGVRIGMAETEAATRKVMGEPAVEP